MFEAEISSFVPHRKDWCMHETSNNGCLLFSGRSRKTKVFQTINIKATCDANENLISINLYKHLYKELCLAIRRTLPRKKKWYQLWCFWKESNNTLFYKRREKRRKKGIMFHNSTTKETNSFRWRQYTLSKIYDWFNIWAVNLTLKVNVNFIFTRFRCTLNKFQYFENLLGLRVHP